MLRSALSCEPICSLYVSTNSSDLLSDLPDLSLVACQAEDKEKHAGIPPSFTDLGLHAFPHFRLRADTIFGLLHHTS